MKKLSIFLCSLILFVCAFTFIGCGTDIEKVTGTYHFVGGYYGNPGNGPKLYISTTINGNETFPYVVSVPENIVGFMDKSSFYVEITNDKMIEHGNIQYSDGRFLVNHNSSKEYEYKLTSRNNSVDLFNILDKDGNPTCFHVWEDGSLVYEYYFEDGNVLCLSFHD